MNWILSNEKLAKSIEDKLDVNLTLERLTYATSRNEKTILKTLSMNKIKSILSNILVSKNLETKIIPLINEIHEGIESPYNLINADKAAELIYLYAIDRNATIYIYADYDADGINAGYVAFDALSSVAKCKVVVYYPNRKDGYGLNTNFCTDVIAKKNGRTLVITVDNGITKVEEVELLKANGIDVIVTDHHKSQNEVPDCLIVNPHNYSIKQNGYYTNLSGCGVVFKVMEILQSKFGVYNMLKYIPNFAITVLSDVMSLDEENCSIVQYGLDIINSKHCPIGLKTLKEQLGLEYVTTKDVLFSIAPILNACGRMEQTEVAASLLASTTKEEAVDFAIKAMEINEVRKGYSSISEKILSSLVTDDKLIIHESNEYPKGVVGIVAGKIAEHSKKPSMVVVRGENGTLNGSVRSAQGINIFALLSQINDMGLLESFGGHEQACACGFKEEHKQTIIDYFNENISDEDLKDKEVFEEEQELIVSGVIDLQDVNQYTHSLINLIPYDSRTISAPVFAILNCDVVSATQTKNNPKNMWLTIRQNDKEIKLWCKDLYDRFQRLEDKTKIHIAGTVEKNFLSFGAKYVINIVDIK